VADHVVMSMRCGRTERLCTWPTVCLSGHLAAGFLARCSLDHSVTLHTLDGAFGSGQFKAAAWTLLSSFSLLDDGIGHMIDIDSDFDHLHDNSAWTWTLVLMVGWIWLEVRLGTSWKEHHMEGTSHGRNIKEH
jgi:hypothetical protein